MVYTWHRRPGQAIVCHIRFSHTALFICAYLTCARLSSFRCIISDIEFITIDAITRHMVINYYSVLSVWCRLRLTLCILPGCWHVTYTFINSDICIQWTQLLRYILPVQIVVGKIGCVQQKSDFMMTIIVLHTSDDIAYILHTS